jgi:hypothetical protein
MIRKALKHLYETPDSRACEGTGSKGINLMARCKRMLLLTFWHGSNVWSIECVSWNWIPNA